MCKTATENTSVSTGTTNGRHGNRNGTTEDQSSGHNLELGFRNQAFSVAAEQSQSYMDLQRDSNRYIPLQRRNDQYQYFSDSSHGTSTGYIQPVNPSAEYDYVLDSTLGL